MSTRVSCTIDLTADGKQFGTLGVPRSSNQWSDLTVPIVSVANGAGPTALVIGGVHGDEPEGQVAALNLARTLQPEQVTGRVIVIPCASPEASRAYTRLWPSGANLNRSFPGSPTGPANEQLAHFLSTELFPISDEIVVSTELGGGGHVTAEIHRLASSGLANVVRHFGALAGEPVRRASPPKLLMATEPENYVPAPESGLFETLVDLGQQVEPGEPVGRIHFLERVDREPEAVHAKAGGIVCVVRGVATTEQGDNVVVVAREADFAELA